MALRSSLRRRIRRIPGRHHERLLRDVPFCVISDSCWGGQLYRHVRRPYNTPFVGLGVDPPDFRRLLLNLEGYLGRELEFDRLSYHPRPDGIRWPLARLGDVSIRLSHYDDFRSAREKWNRRVERMDLDHLYVVFHASRKRTTPDDLEPFLALPYPRKVAFTREPRPGAVTVPAWCNDGAELFTRSQQVFDAFSWIATGDPTPRRRDARWFAAASNPAAA